MQPHRGRGRHRRHAVPRRLGDDGALPPGPRHPPGGPPTAHRPARCDRPAPGGRRRLRRPAQPAGRPGPRAVEGVVDPRRDRPRDRAARPRRDRGRPAPGPERRPRVRRGLAEAAGARAPGGGGAVHQPAAAARAGDRRHPRAPRLARRQPLHLPRLPRVRPADRRRRHDPARGAGHRARHPAVGSPDVHVVSPDAAGGARQGAREEAADPHQGQLPLDRAPSGVPRLHRGQDVRRER